MAILRSSYWHLDFKSVISYNEVPRTYIYASCIGLIWHVLEFYKCFKTTKEKSMDHKFVLAR